MIFSNTAPHKKILIINGHPNAGSFCSSIASQYADTARLAGHGVHVLHLGDMQFESSLKAHTNKPSR